MSKSLSAKGLKKFSKYYLNLKIRSINEVKRDKDELNVDLKREKWILKELKKKYIIKKIH